MKKLLNKIKRTKRAENRKSKFAVVTGASSGLGYIFAHRLAAQGLNIIAVARRKSLLEKLSEELRVQNVLVEILVLDLSREEDVEKLSKVFLRENVCFLVNNAGLGNVGRFVDLTPAQAHNQIAVNVNAVVRLSHAAAHAFIRRGEGSILNIGSIAGFMPIPGFAVYAATKAFVKSFSGALAQELKGTGVRIASVCPGYTRTEFAESSGLNKAVDDRAMSAADVVEEALIRFEEGENEIVIGLSTRTIAQFGTLLPTGLAARISDFIFKRQMVQK